MMKLAILGATGGTGQELVKQALALGHTVKVLVRSPEKVILKHDRLEVVKMDLLNESAAALAEKLGAVQVRNLELPGSIQRARNSLSQRCSTLTLNACWSSLP
jgi:putative NADH-flavin reductase